ncbi:MAG: mechanosensitive ion channel family protein [Opitutales bacterium]
MFQRKNPYLLYFILFLQQWASRIVPVVLLSGFIPFTLQAQDETPLPDEATPFPITPDHWLGHEALPGILWWQVLAAAGILLAAGLLHLIVQILIKRQIRRAEKNEARKALPEHEREASSWISNGLDAALAPLNVLIWTYGVYGALYVLLFAFSPDTIPGIFLLGLGPVRDLANFVLIFWFLFRMIRVVEAQVKEWADDAPSRWDWLLAVLVTRALRLTLPLIAIMIGLPLLPIPPQAGAFLHNGVSVLIIIFVAFLLYQLVKALEEGIIRQFRVDVADNLQARKLHTQVSVLRKIALVIILVFAMASILMVFEPMRQFGTSMLASAGVAGIIIGFAAQRSLSSLLAGFQIAITQPIRLDDVLIVEGEWGRVEEITLTYVVVRIWDLRRLVLPITYFIEQPFQNWTRTSAEILGTVFFYADYTVPVAELRKELERILRESGKWDGKVQGLVVTDARERTIEIRALMSAADAGLAWDLRCEVREKMVQYIQENYPESLPRFRAELGEHKPEIPGRQGNPNNPGPRGTI